MIREQRVMGASIETTLELWAMQASPQARRVVAPLGRMLEIEPELLGHGVPRAVVFAPAEEAPARCGGVVPVDGPWVREVALPDIVRRVSPYRIRWAGD